MKFRRRQRWLRRFAFGLAFASVAFAGATSQAQAEPEDTVLGWSYASAGGWSGQVDTDSGMPLSAGISEEVLAIPAEAASDPYLTDIFVRQGEAQRAPDGVSAGGWSGRVDTESGIPLSAGISAAVLGIPAKPVNDPYLTDIFVRQGEAQGGPDGDEIAIRNAIQSRAATKAKAKAKAKRPSLGPVFVDPVFARQGESQGGPDGGARQ